MKFKRIKNSWFIANKHYLIPVFLFFTIINFAVGLFFAVVAFSIWGVNKLRARLPIDPGIEGKSETIIYKTIGTTTLKMDLWRPPDNSPGTATVVFAHGGGWVSGKRTQPNIVSWSRFLSSRGFSVASVDYRFAYMNNMAEIIEDYSDSVNFIQNNAERLGVNSKIILMGLSAGGHLALCHAAFNTCMSDEESESALSQNLMKGVCGVVAYYAPTDLIDLFSSEDKSFFARFGAGSAMKTLPRFDEDVYEKYSPINSFSKKMPPVMAVHGHKDEVVPFHSSVKTIKRLKALNVPCRFLIHKNGSHGFETKMKDYRTTLILEETVRFMRKIAEK
ncbi:MAG: alpha/beta hydrolase [Spirochaetales bacterium]|nr:alpha/beta hydrolase [Spirochaetales bacterium]